MNHSKTMTHSKITISDLDRLVKEGKIRGYVDSLKSEAKISKYGNKKVELDGHVFDSKRECRRYQDLKALLLAGEISDLKLQVPFQLSVCKYVADFVYQRKGETVVEDAKGFKTQTYRLKKKLMKEELNIEIKEL